MTCVGFGENGHGDSLTASWDEDFERDAGEHRRNKSTCLQVVVQIEEAKLLRELFNLEADRRLVRLRKANCGEEQTPNQSQSRSRQLGFFFCCR